MKVVFEPDYPFIYLNKDNFTSFSQNFNTILNNAFNKSSLPYRNICDRNTGQCKVDTKCKTLQDANFTVEIEFAVEGYDLTSYKIKLD